MSLYGGFSPVTKSSRTACQEAHFGPPTAMLARSSARRTKSNSQGVVTCPQHCSAAALLLHSPAARWDRTQPELRGADVSGSVVCELGNAAQGRGHRRCCGRDGGNQELVSGWISCLSLLCEPGGETGQNTRKKSYRVLKQTSLRCLCECNRAPFRTASSIGAGLGALVLVVTEWFVFPLLH